jgi:hypothetical protein
MSEPFMDLTKNDVMPKVVKIKPITMKSSLLSGQSIADTREYKPTSSARTNQSLTTQESALAYAFNAGDAMLIQPPCHNG